MKNVTRALAAAVSLAAAACGVSADKVIPCYDDSSCPSDYPVCDGGSQGHTGVCKAPAAGDSQQAAAYAKILGVQGGTSNASKGAVQVDVIARARAGVKQVSLKAADGTAFQQIDAAKAPKAPLFTFLVPTPAGDGQLMLTATVDSGDGASAKSEPLALSYDNTAPTLSITALSPADARPGSIILVDVASSEPLASIKGTISGGDSMASTPGATALSYRLAYQVPADASQQSYTVSVDGTDLAGNTTSASAGQQTQTYLVRRPFKLTAPTALGAALEGTAQAVAANQNVTVSLTLPSTVLLGSNKPVFTLLDGAGHSRPFATSVSASGLSWTVSEKILTTDASGTALVVATVTDPSGNSDSSSAPLLIDNAAPIVTSLVATNAVTDVNAGVQTINAVTNKELQSASIQLSNSDLGTCTVSAALATCTVTLSNPATSASVLATLTLADKLGNTTLGTSNDQVRYQLVPLPTGTIAFTSPAPVAGNVSINPGTPVTLQAVWPQGTTASINGVTVSGANVPATTNQSGSVSFSSVAQTASYSVHVTNSFGSAFTSASVKAAVNSKIYRFVASQQYFTLGAVAPITLFGDFAGGGATGSGPGVISCNVAASCGAQQLGSTSMNPGQSLNITPAATTTYTLTVTPSGAPATTDTQVATVTVVPNVSGLSLSAGSATLVSGSSTTLIPTFSFGVGQVLGNGQASAVITGSDGSGYALSGTGPINVSPMNGGSSPVTVTYTLTVANAAGTPQTALNTITVYPGPSIATFTATNTTTTQTSGQQINALAGQAILFNFAFANGTGSIDHGVGTGLTSGQAITIPAPGASTTYTLTVVGASGSQTSRSILVVMGTFATGVDLITMRTGATMTLLPGTNRVLVVGGANQSGTVLPSAQICLADMSSCSATGSLALQRYFHTATVVGTKIFIAGGWTAAGLSVATSSVEVCDVGAGSNPSCVFTTAPTMVNAHAQHAAVMTGLKILVVGGGGSTSAEVLDLNAVTPAWAGTTNAPLATHGAGVSATLLSDNATVLVVGGSAKTSVLADLYSFTTGKFTASTATLASDVSNHTATLMPGASNKVLVAGGHTSSGTSLNTWLYDSTAIPTTNAFTAGPNLATAREFFTATLLGTNEVLLAGGQTGTTPLNTSERVTADGSSISPSGNLTAKRTQHAALRLIGGNVAITGGSTTTTAEIYTP